MAKIDVGETLRFDCDRCGEWEVTFEPKVAEGPEGCGEGMTPVAIGYCPGCGEACEIGDDQ